MPLDLTRPVYVKKQILDVKAQNTYPIDMERPYRAETIPDLYRNDIYLTNDNGKKPVFVPTEVPFAESVIFEPVNPIPTKKTSAIPPAIS